MLNEELVKEIKQGVNVKNNLEVLYLKNKGFIYIIVKRYMAYADIDDLMQEGFIGLYNAIDPYEEVQGVLFISYAAYHIKQAVNRYIENCGKTVRIPVHLTSLIHNYKKVMNYYSISKNRKPSDRELCAMLDTNLKTLENIRNTISKFDHLESLNNEINGLEDTSITICDSIADDINIEDSVIDSMMDHKMEKELWEIVERETNDIENEVIHARYKKALSLNLVGQGLGISKEAVRQWESKALRKLRRSRVTRELKDKFDINMARAYKGSLSSFKYNWSSSTESVALKNIELMENI